jgi:hypothetical protein
MQVNKKTTALKLIPGGLNTLTGGNTMNTSLKSDKVTPEPYEYDPTEFEDFTHKGSKVSKIFVTVLPRGGLSFSSGAVHDFQLDRFNFIWLGYSNKSNRIRLKFNNDRTIEDNMGLVKTSSSMTCNAVSFFSWYGLDTDKFSARYELREIGYNTGVFIIDLNTILEEIPQSKKKKQQNIV